jgi:hypothetical protein
MWGRSSGANRSPERDGLVEWPESIDGGGHGECDGRQPRNSSPEQVALLADPVGLRQPDNEFGVDVAGRAEPKGM